MFLKRLSHTFFIAIMFFCVALLFPVDVMAQSISSGKLDVGRLSSREKQCLQAGISQCNATTNITIDKVLTCLQNYKKGNEYKACADKKEGCYCTVTNEERTSANEPKLVPSLNQSNCSDDSVGNHLDTAESGQSIKPEEKGTLNRSIYTNCQWYGTSADGDKSLFATSDGNLGASLKALDQLPGTSPQKLIGRVIKTAMGIIGTIALVVMVYAGILWMVATGNAQRENEAKEILYWGALGILIVLGSYAIVQFIIDNAFT